MVFCTTCGAIFESTASFCTSCGVVVAQPDSLGLGEIENQSPRQEAVEVVQKPSGPSTRSRSRLAVPAAAVVAALVTGAVVYAYGVIRQGVNESVAVVATTVLGDDTEELIEEVAQETVACNRLVFGTILPVTGSLAFLGPPMIVAAELAIQDINASGGVRYQNVDLYQGDSSDTSNDTANLEVDRLLSVGAKIIIGAASSRVSLNVIDKITSADVIQFSPSNTSPSLTGYPDNGLYFRTAPSDNKQAQVLAQLIVQGGGGNVVVLHRDDEYGKGIADAFEAEYRSGDTFRLNYTDLSSEFSNYAEEIVFGFPAVESVLIVGFGETAEIVESLSKTDSFKTGRRIYLADGSAIGLEYLVDDAEVLFGVQGVIPAVDFDGSYDLIEMMRRLDANGVGGVYDYAAETYDAIVISALAAQMAGCDEFGNFEGAAIAEYIPSVTGDGQSCSDFASCNLLIEAGSMIDYQGLGGPYDFDANGDPTVASFRVVTYGYDGIEDSLDRYVFSS